MLQHLHTAKLFTFIHGHAIDLTAQLRNRFILIGIIIAQRFIVGKGIQKL